MTENQITQTKSNDIFYIIIIVLLLIVSGLAFLLWKNFDTIFSLNKWMQNSPKNTQEVQTPTTQTTWEEAKNITIKIIWDKRCSDCQTTQLSEQLKVLPFFSWSVFEELDFSDKWVKELLKENEVNKLPAILVSTNEISDKNFVNYLTKTKWWLYSLNVWAEFDPFAEICDNKVDDNWDGAMDCEDKTCSNNYKCKKVDKPVADLYIMSYCPYGLQAQKWYLEVMSKLWKVADINVKFVQYVMHEKKESDENVVQYCIQKEQKSKYTQYLNCFLAEEWKNEACRKEAKIDEKSLNSCIEKTKKEFKVDEKMADKSKQFPDFDLNKDEALKAWVQWSPTFVLNGSKIDKIWRDANSFASAICSTFKNKPKECEQEFAKTSFDPMFWFTSNWKTYDSWCAQ